MHAIICQVADRPGVGMLPVAGRPLIARQIQWLRSIGCERIVVEVDADHRNDPLAVFLASQDSVGVFAEVVLTNSPCGAQELALRAGLPRHAPFLAVPSDVLGGGLGTLHHLIDERQVEIELLPSPYLPPSLERASVRLFGRGLRPEAPRAIAPGWGTRVASMHDALALGVSLLSGLVVSEADAPLPIHAAERRPGVWVARGASVSDEAELVSPVLIGPGAYIGPGARVGPDACVGERAVVEPDAVVERAQILDGATVPEGTPAVGCAVSRRGLESLRSGVLRAPLSPSIAPSAPSSWLGRLAALLALVALAPLALPMALAAAARGNAVFTTKRLGGRALRRGAAGFAPVDLAVKLLDVVSGARAWVGVGDSLSPPPGASPVLVRKALQAPCGVIDIEPALADDDPLSSLRVRAWYGDAKGARVDAGLLAELARSPRRREPIGPIPSGSTSPSAYET